MKVFSEHPNNYHRVALGLIALMFIAAAVVLLVFRQQVEISGNLLPEGSVVGGLPAGGLSAEEALAQVDLIYGSPLELRINGARIQVDPQAVGFSLDQEAMITAVKDLLTAQAETIDVPLIAEVDESLIIKYLQEEILPRYNPISSELMAKLGLTTFEITEGGSEIDMDGSKTRINKALLDPKVRSIDLPITTKSEIFGDLNQLKFALIQELAAANFNGVAEVFIRALPDGEVLNFAIRDNSEIPAEIAFSAASTIKIPILLSVLRRTSEPIPDEISNLMERMLVFSENPPADALMDIVIGSTLAPLTVSEDIQQIGLENTFLAGYFYLGAPLLERIVTPANSRTDINLNPDDYNQTTAKDMGKLLTAIYDCAYLHKGLLIDVFAGEITPSDCSLVLDIMKRNKIGVLTEAGMPEGTSVAHKHGWTEESDGYLHTLSDAGIVFGAKTDFVFTAFLYDSEQLLFDPANALIAQMAQTAYNFYHPYQQINWVFGEINYR